jgi:hypothetical protein
MHGKNPEISQGMKMLMPTRREDFINYRRFGFNILLETIENEGQTYKSKKKDGVKEIEKYESGELTKVNVPTYTEDALVFQSILEYSIDFGTTDSFRSRKVSKEWLLGHCPVFVKEYAGVKGHTSYKARVEHINPRVTQCLEKLRYLDLLESRNVMSNNKEDTVEYKFTKLGRLIALLLKQIKPKESSHINYNDKIYRQTLLYYDDKDHSIAKFCSIFFRKCYEKDIKLFDIIINRLVAILQDASDDKKIFLTKLRRFQAFYNHPQMWELFRESLDELRNRSQEDVDMFLYELKLEIEAFHEYKSRNLRSFENIRWQIRTQQNQIALEGYCKSCQQFIPCAVSLLEYFQAIVEEPDKSTRVNCPNCIVGRLDFETLDFP